MIENLKHYGKDPSKYNVRLFAAFIVNGTIGSCRYSYDRLEENPTRFVKDVTTLGLYGTSGYFKGEVNK